MKSEVRRSRFMKVIPKIVRYACFAIGGVLFAIAYNILMLKVGFITLYNPDDVMGTSVQTQNARVIDPILWTCIPVGLLFATRNRWLRAIALVIVGAIWIYPLVHWFAIDSPK